MILAPRIGIHLSPFERVDLAFVNSILEQWMVAELEPAACRRILESALSSGGPGAQFLEGMFNADAIAHGGLVASDALLYPSFPWSLKVLKLNPETMTPTWRQVVDLADDDFPRVARLLRDLTRRGHQPARGDVERQALELLHPTVAAALVDTGEPNPSWRPLDRPGIYRREHGSVIIRSETTTLLFDPLCFWFRFSNSPSNIDGAPVDAVIITHGHNDHFNVASLLHAVEDEHTPVLVPPCARENLLAPVDMSRALGWLGQKVLAPAWGSTLTIGDIEIDVLPFYGEQPTRNGPKLGELRNYGSCHRITTPQMSVFLLIDSGSDPDGSMVDVVRASSATRGPVDFILSSLPRFHSPFFYGLPLDYLALPFDALRSLFELRKNGTLPSVTPGPAGVAEICVAAGARYYLPYGNGYEGVGKPIDDVGFGMGEPSEAACVEDLRARFEARGVATQPITWNPGDVLTLRDGRAHVDRAS